MIKPLIKIIKEYNKAAIFLSILIWSLGLYFLVGRGSMFYALFIPIGSGLFYFTLIVRLFRKREVPSNVDSSTDDYPFGRNHQFKDFLSWGSELKMWVFFWLFFIGLVMYMPFSNIYAYQKIKEQMEWKVVKAQLDVEPQLEATFGNGRNYSSPEWLAEDSLTRLVKIHTGGHDKIYGTFNYVLNSKGQILYLDSIRTEEE